MKNLFGLFPYLLTIILLFPTSALSEAKLAKKNKLGELKFKTIWTTNKELTVNVYRELGGQGHLEILDTNKKVFQFNPKIVPEAFFQLQDGNLATLWYHAGNGRKHIYIFTHQNGRIHQVLDASSLLSFEFVFPSNNEDFTQRILVTDVDWVQVNKPLTVKESTRLPKMVDIYKWNNKSQQYDRSSAPWSKKFEYL